MSQIEDGILSFTPKGYVLAKDGEKFGGSTRIFTIVNMYSEIISKWATAASTQDGKETFLHWFKKRHPNVVPPFRGKIYVFRERKALPI